MEQIEAELRLKTWQWRSDRSLESAEDLVAAAVVFGQISKESKEAAEQIISSQVEVGSKSLAAFLLNGNGNEPVSTILTPAQARSAIRLNRIRLTISPRDSLLLAETALHYSMLGQTGPAQRMLWQAFNLTPNDRYVIRAFVRFLDHVGDEDAALSLAKKISSQANDPWIVAARLGALRVSGRSPDRLKPILGQLDDASNNPFDISELASAVGTTMLENGDSKRARKRFRQSLVSPTENSVAQAEWANTIDKSIVLPDTAIANPEAHEARAWLTYKQEQWQESLVAAQGWMNLDPLQAGSFIYGSFLAVSILDRPDLAVNFATRGIKSNPDNATLLNNLAVAHALLGEVAHAREVLDRTRKLPSDTTIQITLNATEGLIRFREGNFEGGVESYLAAISQASTQGLASEWVRALSYLAVEVSRFNPVEADSLAQEAQRQVDELSKRKVTVSPDTLKQLRHSTLQSRPGNMSASTIYPRLPPIPNGTELVGD